MSHQSTPCLIRKTDDAKQIVFGEVYAPNVVDTHGHMMLAEEVEALAHKFLKIGDLSRRIDKVHDNVPQVVYPVESFIAREGDPDGYTPGAWVLGVKIEDPEIWAQVKKGELNGFSFEAMINKQQAIIEMEITPEVVGVTEPAEDGHTHFYVVQVNDDGRVSGGMTSETNGHTHEIKRATATEESAGHAHRFVV